MNSTIKIKIALIVAVCLVVGVLVFYAGSVRAPHGDDGLNTTSTLLMEDTAFYIKSEGWGPCPPNATCHQRTEIYLSGKVIVSGAGTSTAQLSPGTTEEIKRAIRSSGVLDKACEGPRVMDYGAHYTFTLDGKVKSVDFPGCEKEIETFDTLIGRVLHPATEAPAGASASNEAPLNSVTPLTSVTPIDGFPVQGPTGTVALAQCLRDKKITMYGAFWCPHCQNEKQAFGDAFTYVPYIECSTPDGNGELAVCTDKEVKSYPTWVFPGGKRLVGEQGLTKLSEASGCPL